MTLFFKLKIILSIYHWQQWQNVNILFIGNTSFGWWAQYLGDYSDKIVIAPSKWYAKDVPCDLMDENWIKIDV